MIIRKNLWPGTYNLPDVNGFPREGNNWSFRYARRQWNLGDDPGLKYRFLAGFDKGMIGLAKGFDIFRHPNTDLIREHSEDKLLIFRRTGLLFGQGAECGFDLPDFLRGKRDDFFCGKITAFNEFGQVSVNDGYSEFPLRCNGFGRQSFFQQVKGHIDGVGMVLRDVNL